MRLRSALAPLSALLLAWYVAPPDRVYAPTSEPTTAGSPRAEEGLWTDRESSVDLPLPGERDAFTFAVFGDRTGGPAEGVAVLAQAVEDVNLVGPDLVMTVGDLVEGYNQTAQWMAQMEEYRGIMGRLSMPWFPVAGNHDVYWRGPDKPEGEHDANYERHFGPLWYAFRHEGCVFIALYSDEGDPETGEKNFGKPSCQRMSPEQFAFLDRTLTATADARHVFVFLHHPRWLGGGYGEDWQRVHARLAAAGNVSAVFAGHIHRMRYDGVRDGIEYFTLATVGGHQAGDLPEAGYLHQYHLVTVDDDGLDVVSYPVGSAQDPRAITGELSDRTRALANGFRPEFRGELALDSSFGASGIVRVAVKNPSDRPIELAVRPTSDDLSWSFQPGGNRLRLEPGADVTFGYMATRQARALDATFRVPEVEFDVTYAGEGQDVPLPTRTVAVPLDVSALELPERPEGEGVLRLDGRSGHLRVEAKDLHLPDGPFTLECWMLARAFAERQGVACKTESSEYGFFANGGRPEYSVHLGGRYVTAAATAPLLETGRWHHLAGVYDGEAVSLYVDGRLVAHTEGSGPRTANDLPLLIGADVGRGGSANAHLHGDLDEVRLSTGVRYAAESFEPERRFEADGETVLLLHMDGATGPWVLDASEGGAHATVRGGASVVVVAEDGSR